MQLWIKDSNPGLTLISLSSNPRSGCPSSFSCRRIQRLPEQTKGKEKKRTRNRRLPFKNQAQGLGSSRNASSLVRDKPNGRLRRTPVYRIPVTHLKTATSFLNPCNCCGLGSETFSVFIATAPIIQTH